MMINKVCGQWGCRCCFVGEFELMLVSSPELREGKNEVKQSYFEGKLMHTFIHEARV